MLQLDKETIKGRSAYSKFSGKINLGDSRILSDNADQLLFQRFVPICFRICIDLFQIGLRDLWICST